ncbi:MAG: SMC family ATPase [Lachnospiraceae bacterium]|nr:SMC family ATPase [Lachnospiraceae bacterium]
MKPIYIEMSAFGSYGGVETVDFSRKQEGLFLITGDTGAGKTTVFDAMMYALYGKTSGGERSGAMMRSHYAGRNTKTYVRFAFTFLGENYQITRNPEYVMEKTLKNGKIKQQKVSQSVELLLPEGKVFPGKKQEVEERIREIVGLTGEQFCQMAMIAQGDFLKLLYAKTDERKKIFSHLFGTGIYVKIQEEFRRHAAVLEDRIKEKSQAYRQEYARKIIPPGLEDTGEDTGEYVSNLSVLEEYISFGKNREREIKAARTECKDEHQKILEQISIAQETEKLFAHWKKALLEQEELSQRRDEILNLEKRLKKGEAAEWVRQKEENAADAKTAWEENQKYKGNLRAKDDMLKQSLELSQNAVLWLESYRKMFLLGILSQELGECIKHRKQEEERKEIWQKSVEDSLAKRDAYEKKYSVFLREQAGILAKELKEKEPCPVCGAREHPHPACLTCEAVGQQEVEKAREIRDEAEEKREKAHQEYRLKEQQSRNLWQQFFLHVKDSFGEELSEREAEEKMIRAEESLEEEAAEREKKLEKSGDWQGFIREIKAHAKTCRGQEGVSYMEEMKGEADKRIQKMQEEKDTNRGTLEAVEQEGDRLFKEWDNQNTIFQSALGAAGFEDETAYRESLAGERERNRWAEEIRSYQNQVVLKEGEVKGLSSQVKGKKQRDMEGLKTREKELRQRQGELENQYMKCHSANENNRNVRQNLISLENECKMLREDAAVAESLSRTAGGRLNQSVKMDLETYIQRRYFKQIIAQANKRFIAMTDRQFMLRLKEETLGKGRNEGLDLMVYAIATGTLRDIRTLSGGESFLAALSLALGLSDIVMKQSGGIRLDMMFIDEGFGSLDEGSRKKAIEVLQQLSMGHRLIGIISHVTELKEQLDDKLCVTRNEKGSSVCWEIS